MSYIRIYPDKNNTIFKPTTGSSTIQKGLINTGKNPVFELNDGAGKSRILLGFNLNELKTKLEGKTYTYNLKLYDGGVLRDIGRTPINKNSISNIKPINLYYFNSEFVEGDGFNFSPPNALESVSNWEKRTNNDYWVNYINGYFNPADNLFYLEDTFTTPIIPILNSYYYNLINGNCYQWNGTVYFFTSDPIPDEFKTPLTSLQLQSRADDLTFTYNKIIENGLDPVKNSIENEVECNFALNFDIFDSDDVLYTKFVKSRHTKTIFKPYLEFFIEDNIVDSRYMLKQDTESTLYLINWNLTEIENLSVVVTDLQLPIDDIDKIKIPIVTYLGNGIHSYTYLPLTSGEFQETWSINSNTIAKSMMITKPGYNFIENSYSTLYFYPTTYYNKNIIFKNDIVKFNIIAKDKRKNIVSSNFEYKILTTSDFEICPWSKVSVYGEEIFFYVDTSYFYEEIEYEVYIRFKNGERLQTSPDTYKFKLIYDGVTRFDNVSASPYNDRDIYLKR